MTDARAIIRISALPDSSLRKALDKTLGEATKASKRQAAEEIKAAKDAERERLRAAKAAEKAATAASKAAIKAAQDHQKAVTAAAKQEARDAERAAKQQAREAEKLAREEVKWAEWAERLKYRAAQATARMAEREAAVRSREAQKTARQQVQESERAQRAEQGRARKLLFAAGGAAIGLGTAALGRVRSFQGAFGAQSGEQMLAKQVEMQRRLVILSDMGGITPEQRGDLNKKLLATSARTGLDVDDLLGGLETAQDRFSDLKGFSQILDQVADIAVATNTPLQDVVASMGVYRRQLQMSDDDMKKLGGAMVSAADLGSINFREMSTNMPAAIGALGRNANMRGLPGAIKTLAITQALGESDVGAAEASTLGVRLVDALNDVKVQAGVKKAFGVNLTKGGVLGGVVRDDLPTVLQELVDKGFMSPSKGALRQAVFTEERSRRGIEVLTTLWKDHPEKVRALLSVSPEEGAKTIQRRMAELSRGPEAQAATLAARQFQTFAEGEGMQKYLDAAVKSADSLAKIEAGHPIATEIVGITADVLKGLAGALLAQKVFAGAEGAAAAAGGAAGAGTLAKAAGVAGKAVGVVGVGVGAYVATTALMDVLGFDPRKIGSGIYSALHYEAPRLSAQGMGYPTSAAPPNYSEARPDDYVSREPIPWSPAAPPVPAAPRAPTPEATLNIKVDGPARVTSVDSSGFGDIALMSVDTGRRTTFPP